MKYYTEEHQWIDVIAQDAVIGLTAYAFENKQPVTYVDLPEPGGDFIVGDQLFYYETGEKDSVSFTSPLSGTVKCINEELVDAPDTIKTAAGDRGWICRLTDFDEGELGDLMNEEAYFLYLRSQGKV